MGAKGYRALWTNLIAGGKKIDLFPYSRNLLNKNLLSHSVRNPACLTVLPYSRERFMTHLLIMASFPPRRGSTHAEVTNKLVFILEILTRKADIKGILITKHWEVEIINHIL